MPKWKPKVGDIVSMSARPYNPTLPFYDAGKVVRRLNPKRESYGYEVEIVSSLSRFRGQRFCFNADELWPLDEALRADMVRQADA